MCGEWRKTTLGAVTEFLSGGTPPKDRPDYWEGSVPWVSAKDMKQFRLDDTQDHVSETGVVRTKLVPAGSVLLLVRGMTLLNDLPICVISRPMTFNQDIKALRPKPHIRSDFLPYLLLGNKDRLLSRVDLAGHGTGRLNSDELRSLDVVLPPEPEQRAIAHIIGTLDDKIELNRKMNETLVTMVRTLFKSWFVDFDPVRAKVEGRDTGLPQEVADLFPDSFEDLELREVPKGWGVANVGEIAALNRSGLNPGDFEDELFAHYSLPAFDDGRTPKIEAGQTIKSNKFIVSPECVLLSKLNPRIPRIWLPVSTDSKRAVCSTEFLVMLPRSGMTREFLYSIFISDAFITEFASLVTGTSGSHQRVKPESLLALEVVVPPKELTSKFTSRVAPLLQQISQNVTESLTLSSLRDTLLPKLLSGEVQVTDAFPFSDRTMP